MALVQSGAELQGSIMGCHGTPLFHGLGMFMYAAAVRPSVCKLLRESID